MLYVRVNSAMSVTLVMEYLLQSLGMDCEVPVLVPRQICQIAVSVYTCNQPCADHRDDCNYHRTACVYSWCQTLQTMHCFVLSGQTVNRASLGRDSLHYQKGVLPVTRLSFEGFRTICAVPGDSAYRAEVCQA